MHKITSYGEPPVISLTLGLDQLLWAHSREATLSSVAVNDPCEVFLELWTLP